MTFKSLTKTKTQKKWTIVLRNLKCVLEHCVDDPESDDSHCYQGFATLGSAQACLNIFVKELFLDELQVHQLKKLCNEYRISKNGRKHELIERLKPILKKKGWWICER